MKKQGLSQKLITAIVIPAIGLSSLFFTGCHNSKQDYLKNIDCPNRDRTNAEINFWMPAIRDTYGEDTTVHKFLEVGMVDGEPYEEIKKELFEIYDSDEKITTQNMADISCYIGHRLGKLETQ